jgi:hypothetical protein
MSIKVKVKENALELHERLIPENPKIPGGKQKYAAYLEKVVGKTIEVLVKDKLGYTIRVPEKNGKKIVLPADLVDVVEEESAKGSTQKMELF